MTIFSKVTTALLTAGFVATAIAGPADARRGGSFGSRGSRTYSAPRPTQVTPGYTPGLSRSMTPRTPYASGLSQYGTSSAAGFGQRSGSRFGFGSGLLAGVVTGGLLGSLFGHGASGYAGGGGGGMLALLIQLALVGGLVWLAFRLFRRRQPANVGGSVQTFSRSAPSEGFAPQAFADRIPTTSDIALTSADQDAFERLLVELQDAFGQEDYGRLRAITTPEIMSYLAEELSDNAVHGRRNAVSGTRLIDAEVSEAWHEAEADYATIAMRYEGIDVMRDRTSGAVLSGDPSHPSLATEIWTFTRPTGAWGTWKVSAIQEA